MGEKNIWSKLRDPFRHQNAMISILKDVVKKYLRDTPTTVSKF